MPSCFYYRADSHGKDKQFGCVTCSSRFVTQWELIMTTACMGKRPTNVMSAGKGLIDHLKFHVGNKTHPCMCGKMYTYASGLSLHKQTCKIVEMLIISSSAFIFSICNVDSCKKHGFI